MESEQKENSSKKPVKGKVFITDERCKGCSYCVEFCPTNAISMGKKLNHKGYRLPELSNPEACNGCNLCGMYCPDFAIFGARLGKKKKKGE